VTLVTDAPQQLQVMAEYAVGDSPLWGRGPEWGLLDATGLGLSAVLRDDLSAWNDVFDAISLTEFRFPSPVVELDHRVRSFSLAARVQRELGDGWVVTSGAGGGVDHVPPRRRGRVGATDTVLLLTASSPGHADDVVDWAPDEPWVVRAAEVGARPSTVAALVVLRREAPWQEERGTAPAVFRARVLDVAAELQRDVGLGARVFSLAGDLPGVHG